MPKSLIKLLNEVKGSDLIDAFHASRELGLLVESHRQDRYGDTSYEMLLSSKELNQLRLTDKIVERLTEELLSVLENHSERSSLVVWPLGKTFKPSVIDRLLKHLEKNWKDNDILSSEILVVIYDQSLLDNYWGLIEKIAQEGGNESKKLASQCLQLKEEQKTP